MVDGGTGFVGSYLVEKLVDKGANVRIVTRKDALPSYLLHMKNAIEVVKGDLTDMDTCMRAARGMDYVFHVAGLVRGVLYNSLHPGTMLSTNVAINTNMLEAARRCSIERYQFVSSACGYPLTASIPLKEENFFDGEPEPTNGPYGWSKRTGEMQAVGYYQEFGTKISVVRPFNAYGPRDNFDPEGSHVIAALIRKAVRRDDPFIIWGDGSPTRAFIYVTDVADGMLMVMEKMTSPDPINLGTDEEVSVNDIAKLILKLSGYDNAKIIYDKSKPGGQPRRSASIEKAKRLIGFVPKVSLEEGLKQTIEWYRQEMLPKEIGT